MSEPETHTAFFSLLKKTPVLILFTGFIATCLAALLYLFEPTYLELADLKLYDALLEKAHKPLKSDSIRIVDIDDKSLKEFGQWPWPRYRVAALLEKIQAAEPIAVGLDILFSEPDRTSPKWIQKALKADQGIDIAFSNLPNALNDNDQILAEVLKKGRFVLGFSGLFGKNDTTLHPDIIDGFKAFQAREPGTQPADQYLFQAQELIAPLPVLADSATSSGFMNTITDRDGVLRKTPLMIARKNKIYPQLSLSMFLCSIPKTAPKPVIRVGLEGIQELQIDQTRIPLDQNGNMLINYRGPSKTFPYISARDILKNQISLEIFKNKFVLVGTSASGLKDIRVSPFDRVYPGIEVHATLIDNMLSKDFIQRPGWIPGLEFSLIFVWGLVTAALIGWASAALTLPVVAFLAAAAWYGALWSLGHTGIWVSPFFPILILIFNFSFLNMQKYRLSEKKKKFFKTAFSKYVSKSVVDQMAANPERLSLTGEEKQITILFCDIRGFTGISEKLTPSQVTILLNEYFTTITKIILRNKGTHDKFIGDAVMCFWNAPVDVKNHEKHAIKTAIQMIDALDTLNNSFEKKFGLRIHIGIGLHSGRCRVGNMGSEDIFEYTVIGDSVNLASRLESLTKFYQVPIIVSQAMIEGMDDTFFCQELDLVRVKGKEKPVRIYTVFSQTDGTLKKELAIYSKALQLYRDGRFIEAGQAFDTLTRSYPEWRLYQIYRERCTTLSNTPPGGYWDGVFTHSIK